MFYICGKYKNRFLMKTVKLITCNDAMKAHILQGALENEGIESILHNENFSTLYKSCVSSIAGVDILVADDDYEKAVQVLRDNQSWPEELTLCPYCGSSDIKFRLKKGQRLRAVGAAILSMLAAALREIIIGNIPADSANGLLRCLLPSSLLQRKRRKNNLI